MRRAFITFGIIVFLLYCRASVVNQNEVAIPGYKLVKVDVLGGKTRAEWDADPQQQFTRLMELESKKYQLPVGSKIPAGSGETSKMSKPGVTDAEGNISPDHPLTSDDFAHMLAQAPTGTGLTLELRDSLAIYALADHKYILRDPVFPPGSGDAPDVKPLYNYDQVLNKSIIDGLINDGIKQVTITGHSAPVNVQLGTALMVAIIFFTLFAALRPILWDPFIVMLEKRRREMEIGAEAERQNQVEEGRFADEKARRNAQLNREVQDLRMQGQRETAQMVGEIIKAARVDEKKVKLAGLREISDNASAAHAQLKQDVPALAQAVADALTPGFKGGDTRWERLAPPNEERN